MPTVIVLITLPTNIVIIFVRIILMWNNNDEDYDHVEAGNQERDDLGKEVFNTLAVPLLIVIAIYLCLKHLNCSKYQCCGHIKSPPSFQNSPILEHWCICSSKRELLVLVKLSIGYFHWNWEKKWIILPHINNVVTRGLFLRCTHEIYSL